MSISYHAQITSRRCRDVVLQFGAKYKARTDANGALMVVYVGAFTVLIIILSVIYPDDTVSFEDFGFVITAHLLIILMMGVFSVALSLEGDECNEMADRTIIRLSNAVIHLESQRIIILEKHPQNRNSEFQIQHESAVSAMVQLQRSIDASQKVHPVELLDFVYLSKGLVMTVLFGLLTQITLILEKVTL